MFSTKLTKCALAVKTVLLCGGLTVPMMVLAEQENDGKKPAVDETVDEIVITYRGSLKQNLDTKRQADSIVDAITAEDIGKFPDKNVAESLQRIPGISISRDFGEGEKVSIRGTAPDLNMTFLNGQSVATASWFILDDVSRNFNYSMLPSEMVSKLIVHKSPVADVDEGSIGGSVSLQTRKPLALESGTYSVAVQSQYSSSSEQWDPQLSGFASWKNDDDTFGVLAAFMRQDRDLQRNGVEGLGWQNENVNADTFPTGHPWGTGAAMFKQKRERTGLNLTIQGESDKLDWTLNYMKADVVANNINRNYIAIPSNAWNAWTQAPGACDVAVNSSNATSSGGVVTDVDINQTEGCILAAQDIIARDSGMETAVYDLDVNYTSDDFNAHFQLGRTAADGGTKRDLFYEFFATLGDDYADGHLSLTDKGYVFDYTRDATQASADSVYSAYHDFSRPEHNEESYVQGDLEFIFDQGFISRIKTGVKLRWREQGRDSTHGLANFAVANDALTEMDFESFIVKDQPGTPEYWSITQSSGKAWTNTLPVCDATQSHTTDRCVQYTADLDGTFNISEDISALYVRGDFETDHIRGNLGLRYVETEVISEAFVGGEPTLAKSNYSELLPSFNMVWTVHDDVIIRGAASKAIARPDTAQMTSAVTLIPETFSAWGGNPDVEPYDATQFEIGVEWYFAESSLLSLTYFSKDIDGFIVSETKPETINGFDYFNGVNRPRNAGDASIDGFEFQYMQDFGNGFGATLNFTSLDSTAKDIDGSEIGIPYSADSTTNASVYYEDDNFSARISYNSRDDYFIGIVNGLHQMSESFSTFDASILWHATDNIDVSFEAINLNEEETQFYLKTNQGTEVPWTFYENGRRFLVGVSYKF